MKKGSILLVVLLMLGLCMTAAAEEAEPTVYTSGNYKYILLDDGTAEITRYTGNAAELSVPDTLDGHSVTSIGDDAFFGRVGLTDIILPDSVTKMGINPFRGCKKLTDIRVSPDQPVFATIDGVLFNKAEKKLICYPLAFRETEYQVPGGILSIGDFAFSGCDSLISITIPEGLTSIGDGAFIWCTSLTDITLPDSVTEMGINPFCGCEKLTDIRVSPDQPVFATIDGVLFNKAEKKLICYPRAFAATEYQVPGGILSIGDYAFSGCAALTSITLPEGLTSIGDKAFYSCDYLTSVTLPEELTSIGDRAFYSCRSLTGITLPEGLTSIGDNAFFDCDSLTSITLPEGLIRIGNEAFNSCDSLTSITLPEGLTSIGDRAFYSCDSLTSITLPEGLTSIGEYAFYDCPEDMQFTVVRDSWAAKWCKENGKNYTYTDSLDWLNN